MPWHSWLGCGGVLHWISESDRVFSCGSFRSGVWDGSLVNPANVLYVQVLVSDDDDDAADSMSLDDEDDLSDFVADDSDEDTKPKPAKRAKAATPAKPKPAAAKASPAAKRGRKAKGPQMVIEKTTASQEGSDKKRKLPGSMVSRHAV